uniref:Uncharacterized protein n=1 Tax=Dicentrarchus labrax TaxID=13489 RepID=A0A8P4G294_DICLA
MFASAILLCLCVLFILLQLTTRRPKNFPPGPPLVPVLGNLLEMTVGSPLEDFERLRKTYGNVYSLFFGSRPAVIVNGIKAVREALVTNAKDFAGRPQGLLVADLSENEGVILADYGPRWKDHRRFALTNLRNFGMGKSAMEEKIHQEIKFIIDTMDENIGKTMSPESMIYLATSNIVCRVLFNARYNQNDDFINVIIKGYSENAKILNGLSSTVSQSMFLRSQFGHIVLQNLYGAHKKTRVPGQPRDFIDSYLDEMEKDTEKDSTFSEDQMCTFVLDLHFAGTDTTSNTMLTLFLYLTSKPQMQERCQEEIDRVLEGKDQASFEDRHQMHYMQAMIHEVQRVANIVPLNVFHATVVDTELMGYSIPKGTLVIPNMKSVLSEEGQWKYPHEFNPENFLNEQGEFVKPEAFMPFSTGIRMCLGEGLARMELFLIPVMLLRKFKLIWPEDAGEPDYTQIFGGTMSPQPYRIKVQPRSTQ